MLNKKYLSAISLIFITICLFANAQLIMQAVKTALVVCYEKVIPSLFVFMVLAAYISKSKARGVFAFPARWFTKLLKIDSEEAACYMFLSMFGGFAVGARFLGELKEKGYNNDALKVLSVTMINNSVSFVAFGVGIGMLGNYRLGLMLYASLILASMITAFLMSFLYKYDVVQSTPLDKTASYGITNAIRDSVNGMIVICGFVVIFYCVCEVIILYTKNMQLQMILCALTEVTSGCVKIIQIFGKNPYWICVALSLIPISTLSQSKAFAGDAVDSKSLLLSRIIHLPLSLMILSIFINIFPVSAHVYSNNSVVIRHYWNSISLSSTLFFICLFFVIFLDSNKLFTKSK